MRWYWWAALGVGTYYLLKKKPEETMVSYSDAQKTELIKSVSYKIGGVSVISMLVNKDGSLTFTGKDLKGVDFNMTFASPDEVNKWIKTPMMTSPLPPPEMITV